ncbi:MAG: sugar phosphate isomerase/epimerase [Desulfobacteraceae bacterium]|nr:sugar phosphate isomerase/epimerase [Desulfobacteraceae bacterium]MCF8093921.1 sugar phosphate isomerase/epimerase [Desulfobacteraceae bacterium]
MTDRKADLSTEDLPYKPLPESYRNRFSFTLAAPSFIYPDHVLPNVRMLAPFIDEVELVLFESAPAENLPSEEDISELARLSESTGVTYNVHLPIDVNITDPDKGLRADAIERIALAAKRAKQLKPSTWTLHLPYSMDETDPASVTGWQNLAKTSTKTLLEKTRIAPRLVSVETLDYPPFWLKPVVDYLDLSICLDIGHLMEHGHGIKETFKNFENRISILHLYGGVAAGRGHVGLERLPESQDSVVSHILFQFSGIVSLEVFSKKDLKQSLKSLENLALPDAPINP